MKYVLLGSISPSWLGKQAERLRKSNEKLKQLGIKQESVLYTQGQYDFIETIEAPGPSSVLGFTIWYSKKGFGTIQTLPAYEDKEIRKIIKKGYKISKEYIEKAYRKRFEDPRIQKIASYYNKTGDILRKIEGVKKIMDIKERITEKQKNLEITQQ